MAHQSAPQHSNHSQDHVIEHFWSGDDMPCSLTVLCNGQRVLIEFWAKDLREPRSSPRPTQLETEFLQLLSAADESEDEGHDDDEECPEEIPEEVLYDWILKPLQPLFRRLVSTPAPLIKNLWDSLNPPLQCYTLRSSQNRLVAIPHPTKPESLHTLKLPTNMISNLPPAARNPPPPLVKPQELRIAPSSGSKKDPNVVLYNNKPAYFKKITQAAEDSVITEIAALLRIQQLKLDNAIRTPQLLAMVKAEGVSTNHIIGILITVVDSRGDMETMASNAPLALKQAWFRDISHAVHAFHAHNLVWGDVKPENVLIDRNQKAWLIDFGGGWTPGWVDEELENTKQGDLQGLRKIQEFLGLQSTEGRRRTARSPAARSLVRRGSPAGAASRDSSLSLSSGRPSDPRDRIRGSTRERSSSPRSPSSVRERQDGRGGGRGGGGVRGRTRSEKGGHI